MVNKNTNQRIHSLDLLRGFALLGILIMNIISFSNIGIGYLNPTVGAGIEGHNAYFHGFGYLFADMRFMSLFSILFGSGVVLFTKSIRKRNLPPRKYHLKRMFLLLIFGLIHAYFIWAGDILVAYSICGSLVFFMRNWSIRRQSIAAAVLFFVPMIIGFSIYHFVPQIVLDEIFAFWIPSNEEIQTELNTFRGDYLGQMAARIASAVELQTTVFGIETFWRVLSMMLLGMVLIRSGVLSAEKSTRFYLRLLIIGILVGLYISALSLTQAYARQWDGIWYMNIGHYMNYFASIFVAIAYIGIIMLWSKSNILNSWKSHLQKVGRMAFTNYIMTSVICTFIFNGQGLGYFGYFDRLQQWGVVLLVWVLLILMSSFILNRYRQGPLEWLWRRLTYGNQP